jgi:hypothetical protein
MKPFDPTINSNGITIKELREFLNKIPDVNPYSGDDCEVWFDNEDGTTSLIKSIYTLNFRDDEEGFSCDICLGKEE